MRKENWKKPRSHGQHLTEVEKARVAEAYRNNRDVFDVARELGCASRSISRHYELLREAGTPRRTRRSASAPQARFYKSDFVPS